jgi:hypothetical protein
MSLMQKLIACSTFSEDAMPITILDHMANLIFVGAYWVKDILWLRVFSIVGSLVVIPYYYFQSETLWAPMFWSCVFISIHSYRAFGIVQERRPIQFHGDEEILYNKAFKSLTPRQVQHLLDMGSWHVLDVGTKLYSTGESGKTLTVILDGEVEAWREGNLLASLVSGDLLGAPRFYNDSPNFYDATVTQPARVMQWDYEDVHKLAGSDQDLAVSLNKIVGAAVAQKLISIVQSS